jgi:hypothetical protein
MERERNERLIAAMAEADCTNKGLARRVCDLARAQGLASVRCDHNDVRKWRQGMHPRDPKPALVAQALAAKLGRPVALADISMESTAIPPDLGLAFDPTPSSVVSVATQLWSKDAQDVPALRGDVVSAAALIRPAFGWMLARGTRPPDSQGSRRVGLSDVEAVNATAGLFASLDNTQGGGHARRTAVLYLKSEVTPLLHGSYSETVGRALFQAVGQFTLLVASMAYDEGEHGLARRYFVQALSLADAADDRMLGVGVLAGMSHQATFLGDYAESAQLAQAATLGSRGAITATARAALSVDEARALAAQGATKECENALVEAERAFGQSNPDEDPVWFSYFDGAELADEFGHCYRDLGQPIAAARYAEIALNSSNSAYPRSRVFTRLVLASARLGVGEVDDACREAALALPEIGRMHSHRTRTYLADFLSRLDGYGGHPAARDFRELAAPLVDLNAPRGTTVAARNRP